MLNSTKNKEKGFIALLTVILVLLFMFNLSISMNTLLFGGQKISENVVKSTQSYYTAEAGIEDSLLRLKNSPQMPSLSYDLIINDSAADVVIPALIGGSRVITSLGNYSGRIKKMQAVYSIDSQGISFHYGAQVGEGGLSMGNNSEIKGNVFSNGNVTGMGIIDNDVIVAGNGNRLESVYVKGNALVFNCKDSTIDGDLTSVAGGAINNCTVHGSITTGADRVDPEPLPISQTQIDDWKTQATAGGNTVGDINIDNGATVIMGPEKITGSLTISNNSIVELRGTVYVTGTITVNNGSAIKLNSDYGSLSGLILSDGDITIENGAVLTGSGQTGSYLLTLSTSASETAIVVKNNASGAIFYTNSGEIYLNNNMRAREVTGYKIKLRNNAVIEYDSGLANSFFSNGPGGSWKVSGWEEK